MRFGVRGGHIRPHDPQVTRGIGREFGDRECADFRKWALKYRGFGSQVVQLGCAVTEMEPDTSSALGKNPGIRRFAARSPAFAVAHPHRATTAMPQSSVLRKAVARIHRRLAHGRRCATINP
jgi:hypothetical protein